jgi:cytochrome c553
MKISAGMFVAALVLFVGPVGTAADSPSAAVLANTCFSCHGPDGKSAGAMPTLAGKSRDYLSQTMMEFRSGERESTVMARIMKGFSNEEIKALADLLGEE